MPIRTIKEALLKLKAEGKLDKVRMLVLTNCTFDGHIANVQRTMEECLAIKPDLIFLWDEAWFAFARFSPFLRRRTAMGAAAALARAVRRIPSIGERYEAQRAKLGATRPRRPPLLDTRLMPDPDRARVRVYQTNSDPQVDVVPAPGLDDPGRRPGLPHASRRQFHEAFFTHTSTSPNQQIIASLDVARRQMELEGYEPGHGGHRAVAGAAPGDQPPSAHLEVLPGPDARPR